LLEILAKKFDGWYGLWCTRRDQFLMGDCCRSKDHSDFTDIATYAVRRYHKRIDGSVAVR